MSCHEKDELHWMIKLLASQEQQAYPNLACALQSGPDRQDVHMGWNGAFHSASVMSDSKLHSACSCTRAHQHNLSRVTCRLTTSINSRLTLYFIHCGRFWTCTSCKKECTGSHSASRAPRMLSCSNSLMVHVQNSFLAVQGHAQKIEPARYLSAGTVILQTDGASQPLTGQA